MAFLDRWRVLQADGKPFLAALVVRGHPTIHNGPIITSTVAAGEVAPGNTVRTKSGTSYTLGAPLPEDEDCEFARGLLFERVSINLERCGRSMRLEDMGQINQLIDEVLGTRPAAESTGDGGSAE